MASSFYVLDSKGTPLIHRSYRSDIHQDITHIFCTRVLCTDEEKPIFEHEGVTYIFRRVNDVYLAIISKLNCNPLLFIAFLKRITEVFNAYLGCVLEESVRDNFVIIYELLDETMDFGYPQFTEEKVLKEYITQKGFFNNFFQEQQLDSKALPAAVTGFGGSLPWRPEEKRYRKNEVFLDVTENVNFLIAQDGETLSSEIQGTVLLKTQLSGMPDLKLGMNDRSMLEATGKRVVEGKTVDLENVQFHQCVRLQNYEVDRAITFVPPDGEFELMTYRVSSKMRPLIHVSSIVTRHGSSRVELHLAARSAYKNAVATYVNILIPIPTDAGKPEAMANKGSIKHFPEQGVLIWTLKRFAGGKQFNSRCQYTLPSVRSTNPEAVSKRPIEVQFQIPYFTPSGFQVRYLQVTEPKLRYEALPWVRYQTQSGTCHVRTN